MIRVRSASLQCRRFRSRAWQAGQRVPLPSAQGPSRFRAAAACFSWSAAISILISVISARAVSRLFLLERKFSLERLDVCLGVCMAGFEVPKRPPQPARSRRSVPAASDGAFRGLRYRGCLTRRSARPISSLTAVTVLLPVHELDLHAVDLLGEFGFESSCPTRSQASTADSSASSPAIAA